MTTAVLSTPAVPPTQTGTLRVHTLVGHAHVDLTLTCIGSLLRHSANPLSIIIHEDGTLTPEDRERLDRALQQPLIIDRKDADERMHEILRPWPALQHFRKESFWALKILDVSLLTNDPLIAYCDCDMLFLRPFSDLYRIPPGAGGLMMQDIESAYSIRSWHLLRSPSLRLAKDANAGLLCLHRSSLDLPLLESFVAKPFSSTKKYFTEQTCWALLAHAHKFRFWDPRQIAFPSHQIPPQAIALHVVGNYRPMLPNLLSQHSAGAAPATPGTVPTRPCRFHHLAFYETRRVLSRIARKFRKK